MRGARVGEQEETVVGSRPRRRRAIAIAIVVIIVGSFAGSAVTWDSFNAFRARSCKGVGIAEPIDGSEAPDAAAPGFATPEAAIADFARWDPVGLGPTPVPADGWEQYRGRWVRDVGAAFYEVGVVETANGWVVGGDYMICGR